MATPPKYPPALDREDTRLRLREDYEQTLLDLFEPDAGAKAVRPALDVVGHTSNFLDNLRLTVLRGHSVECADLASAIAYLVEEERSYRWREEGEQRASFEVQVRFNTGAKIEATFPKRTDAIAFLRSLA